ncbi:peptide ABC transporter permease [Chryseomicrobium excrementi]|uniref:Peptide ABC transporter permease n=1 Tax=Chryseomicrobium excrementi TaxID=2041346 RepID=A0A2M9F0F5_9BACL|nr:ABC transporter permease [Chryseomicrobium excrementi]PJK16942.1 peptide ABC transporter permease [Chryseomicrobium excrementi]
MQTTIRFIVNRLLKMLFTIWLVTTIIFFLIRLMPSNPIDRYIETQMVQYGLGAEEAKAQASFLFSMDLDQSLLEQYGAYLLKVIQLDFGNSLLSPGVPVMSIIAERLPWTLFTVGSGLLLSFVIGISAGALLAYRRDRWYEPVVSGVSSFLSSIPDFLIAIFLLILFGVVTWGGGNPILPIDMLRGNYSIGVTPGWNLAFLTDAFVHGLLPILTYAISQVGIWVLLMKGSTISTLSADYVTLAKVRGIKPRRILTAYVGRNALLPISTEFAMRLGFIIGGSLIIEQLFVYQGIGLELLKATSGQDYPLMQGIFLIMTIAIVVSSFLAEIFYAVLDPRIKATKGAIT